VEILARFGIYGLGVQISVETKNSFLEKYTFYAELAHGHILTKMAM
jgi:hypothetical protein